MHSMWKSQEPDPLFGCVPRHLIGLNVDLASAHPSWHQKECGKCRREGKQHLHEQGGSLIRPLQRNALQRSPSGSSDILQTMDFRPTETALLTRAATSNLVLRGFSLSSATQAGVSLQGVHHTAAQGVPAAVQSTHS